MNRYYMHGINSVSPTRKRPLRPKSLGYGLIIFIFLITKLSFGMNLSKDN